MGIQRFINNYGIEFNITPEHTAEGLLGNIFGSFRYQKPEQKIYVIIDEYDHFANELLGFETDKFKNLVSKNGKVRKWYEILKEGTESVVDRIFIIGVAPITLDSTTSGFNIATDITKDLNFNGMLGFSEENVISLMDVADISKDKQNELLPVIKQNYDGYIFSTEIKEDFEKYLITEEIKMIPKLRSYSVVAVKDEIYVEEIK